MFRHAATINTAATPHQMGQPGGLRSDVDLEAVEVAAKGASGVWVGVSGAPDLFVVPEDPKALASVQSGSTVDVEGRLQRMPAAPSAAELWQLNPEEGKRIDDDLLYVRATRISPSRAADEEGETTARRRKPANGAGG